MAHRYDYRNDYKEMTLVELQDAEKKLTDRLINTVRDDTRDDCMKRISYLRKKIEKSQIAFPVL